MNIVYASDDNYAEITGVSLLSVYENNTDTDELRVFILSNCISDGNISKLHKIAEAYSRTVTIIDISGFEEIIGTEIKTMRLPVTVYVKLFLAAYLPDDVDRVIFIDCDTMVRSSLLPLWDEDLEGKLLGSVRGFCSLSMKVSIYMKGEMYVNTGTMLIPLNIWRKLNIEECFKEFIKMKKGLVPVVDQGVLNGVLTDKQKKILHPKYNLFTGFRDDSKYSKIKNLYDKDIINEAKDNPVIVHFSGSKEVSKPWIKGQTDPVFQEEYTKYRNMTPWHDVPLREPEHIDEMPKKEYMKQIRLAGDEYLFIIRKIINLFIKIRYKPIFYWCNKDYRIYRKAVKEQMKAMKYMRELSE